MKSKEFKERFEINDISGAWTLTADGCAKRFTNEYTKPEKIPFNQIDRHERTVTNNVMTLRSQGINLSLEEITQMFNKIDNV